MNLGKELLSFAINRNLQCGKFKGHVLKTSVSANSVIKFKTHQTSLLYMLMLVIGMPKKNVSIITR